MKQQCKGIREHLVEYLYEEVDDKDLNERIKAHLQDCPDCARELEKMKAIESAAKSMKVDFPEAVWDMHRKGIKDALASKKKRSFIFNLHFSLKNAGIALALVLILVGVLSQYNKIQKIITDATPGISDDIDMMQNLEIIERLDFYEKISRDERS